MNRQRGNKALENTKRVIRSRKSNKDRPNRTKGQSMVHKTL